MCAMSIFSISGFGLTVTFIELSSFPSESKTVISASPSLFAVSSPSGDTVTTVSSDDLNVSVDTSAPFTLNSSISVAL